MTNAERLQRWNTWYEQVPEEWRFQIVVWALLIVGAVNMLLTIAVGFPFALLLGLAMAAVAAVRVPYVLGWVRTEDEASGAGGARMEVAAPSWVIRANRWYDSLDDQQRPLVLLAALAIPGALNMLLTIAGGFPFGLLFLLALLALVAIRAPYAAGWLKEGPASAAPALTVAPETPRIGDESADPALSAPARSPDGAIIAAEAPFAKKRNAAAGAPSSPKQPRQST